MGIVKHKIRLNFIIVIIYYYLYPPRQIKDYNTKKVTIATPATTQLPLESQRINKPDKTKMPCPICEDLASYISQEIVNNTNITTRKINSKTKIQNSESNNTQDLAALFLN